ncbi:MAG: protein-disulfide reductase DsbD [Epsilonproteobacteria bacterium]|nr:protein-disulfide reductase DsbD [Campylobacterota bacterium]
MKFIFAFVLFVSVLFANEDGFLEPNKAFTVTTKDSTSSIDIGVKLHKTIYVYDDKLEVLINKTNVTKKVFTKKPVDHDGFMVHMGEFIIKVPKTLIKEVGGEKPYTVTFKYQGCSEEGLCYAPLSSTFSGKFVTGANEEVKAEPTSDAKVVSALEPKVEAKVEAAVKQKVVEPVVNEKDETSSIADILSGGNIFLILATFFGFGLLLSLTPCIFPMVPILSSIIVQHSNKDGGKMSAKRGFFLSLVYVLSMSVAYTIAGILAGLFGANIQAMLQDPIVLVIFSGVFVALAFSLFGYYSLELPQSFQNKINNITGGDKNQGIAGVAIMGFLSALIVGPCVAPPLAGALMYIGQTGDAVLGGLALFVMSLGLGMPLLLVGAGAGKYMPKPGGWMETVSKVFGIVMLALAVYMLDRILDPITIMVLWGLVLIGGGLFIKEFKHIIVRIISILILVLGISIIVGALSGATNPLKPFEKFTQVQQETNAISNKLVFEKVHSLKELEGKVASSKKPILVDFWATWCVSCKELDNFTLSDPQVQEALKGYTLLKVDVSANTQDDQEMMKRFNVFGPPALIFYDKDGKLLENKRIVGYKNPKEFLEILNK